jgi:hypothetical protein
MIEYVTIFGLVYSAVNWLLFAWTALSKPAALKQHKGIADVELQGLDPEKILVAAGGLAGAFKVAGAPATAAAMSLVGLIVAALAAGIDKYLVK